MSRSKLEDKLAWAMKAVGLPAPVRELHPFWCCEHRKTSHYEAHAAARYADGTGYPPGLYQFCGECTDGGRHDYSHGRDWRCDFAWPDRKLIVEVEGRRMDAGPAYARGEGFANDTVKYDALEEAGWHVIRFTQREINSGAALNQVERLLKGGTE